MIRNTITLGLDLGITSVGFALVDIENEKILKAGVHLFESAENPKTKASLAAPRREARSTRRRLARRRMRLNNVLRTLSSFNFQDVNRITCHRSIRDIKDSDSLNPWKLRSEGLTRKLTDLEFGIAIYHLAKHRGFKSSKLDSTDSKDDKNQGVMNKAIAELDKEFDREKFITFGNYLLTDKKQLRNKDGQYSCTPKREWIHEELKAICKAQQRYNNTKISGDLLEELADKIFHQRPLKSVLHTKGNCGIFKNEKRAARHSFSAELFVFWQKLNNLNVSLNRDTGEFLILTSEIRNKIYEFALDKATITFKQLRKLLQIDDSAHINLQGKDKDTKEFFSFKGYHAIHKALRSTEKSRHYWDIWSKQPAILDHIAECVSFIFDNEELEAALRNHPDFAFIEQDVIAMLCKIIDLKGTIGISNKAVQILLPDLQSGEKYYKALDNAYERGDFVKEKQTKLSLLPPIEKTNNPVVDRALAQARKIVNAVIREHGLPDHINIELARDLGKSVRERKALDKMMNENRERNDDAKKELNRLGVNAPTKTWIEKYKLWEMQERKCMYSGDEISEMDFINGNEVEIDHIIPFSQSFDDSLNNKALVFTKHNRNKGDKTPLLYLSGDQKEDYLERIDILFNEKLINLTKRKNLLSEVVDEGTMISRHLNDTRWISKRFKDHISEHLVNNNQVLCTKGSITYALRRSWNIDAKDRTEHHHHAEDAILIAFCSHKQIQQLTKENQATKQDASNNKLRAVVALPWDTFKEDFIKVIDKVTITRMPNRKYSGEATAATLMKYRGDLSKDRELDSLRIFSNAHIDHQTGQKITAVAKKVPLSTLNLQNLEKMVDLHRNKKLYDRLKERLEQHNNDPKKAFTEAVYMPRNDGKQGAIVRGIRIYEDSISLIPLRGGVANNGDMVRIDIFKSPKGFMVSPIYVIDVLSSKLPDTVVTKEGKTSKEIPIQETWQFLHSFHKNDFIELVSDNKKAKVKTTISGFFVGFDRNNGSIKLQDVTTVIQNLSTGEIKTETHKDNRFGIKTLDSIKKYHLTLLGEKYLIRNEKRQLLSSKKRMEK
ncbi:MAG: type II CRISPR RNA-guided endonuclease Cas9 [Alphaproteobacteria bacterium]|nr:type II CRISPR RNA-guided endonuclease Cas9 [Alphaproteobacteria bacterium]